jgi:hypothetical protein
MVNNIVDGKQLTVAWHVDDIKISRVATGVVDDLIADLDSEFGKEPQLSKLWGKVHDYLGMTLDFSAPGQVTVRMIDYINSLDTKEKNLLYAENDYNGFDILRWNLAVITAPRTRHALPPSRAFCFLTRPTPNHTLLLLLLRQSFLPLIHYSINHFSKQRFVFHRFENVC